MWKCLNDDPKYLTKIGSFNKQKQEKAQINDLWVRIFFTAAGRKIVDMLERRGNYEATHSLNILINFYNERLISLIWTKSFLHFILV